MWRLEDSGPKTEHLGFRGQAWIHTKFEQSKINNLILTHPAYEKLAIYIYIYIKQKVCEKAEEKVTSGHLAKRQVLVPKNHLFELCFCLFIYSSTYLTDLLTQEEPQGPTKTFNQSSPLPSS